MARTFDITADETKKLSPAVFDFNRELIDRKIAPLEGEIASLRGELADLKATILPLHRSDVSANAWSKAMKQHAC